MATLNDEIYVKIVADTQKATGEIGKLAAQFAAAYLSVEAFKKIVVDSFKAFVAEEQSIVKMNAALRITGQYSAGASAQLNALAKTLQNTTIYADDTARSAEAILIQLSNLSVNGVQKIMPLIADFASSMGLDLVQAAELVGKTLGGDVNALSRYGIQIKDTKDKNAEFNEIIQQMTDKFGGMAQVLGGSVAGQLEQFKNQVDDLKEAFGELEAKLLLPAVKSLNTYLRLGPAMSTNPAMMQSAQEIQQAIDTIVEAEKLAGSNLNFDPLGKNARAIKEYQDRLWELSQRLKEVTAAAAAAPKELFAGPNTAAAAWIPPAGNYPSFMGDTGGLRVGEAKADSPAPVDMAAIQTMMDSIKNVKPQLIDATQGLADMTSQAATLAGYMNNVADAIVSIGDAFASGNIAAGIGQLLSQLAKLLTTSALTAAADAFIGAGGAIDFAAGMAAAAPWLALAGVGIAGQIAGGVIAGSGSSSSGSGGSSLPHDITSKGGINVYVAGSVVTERNLARSIAAVQSNW